MSQLSTDNPRESLTASLITSGLGYCCEAWFWGYFASIASEVISDRLGITPRSVQRRRKLYREGVLVCQMKPQCLNKKCLQLPDSETSPSGTKPGR